MNDIAVQLGEAVRRGTKLSRLRVLRVVCGHGNTLVDVLRFDGKTVLVYRNADRRPQRYLADGTVRTGGTLPQTAAYHSDATTVRDLGSWDRDGAVVLNFEAVNNCCRRPISTAWLREQLDARHARVVAPTPSA